MFTTSMSCSPGCFSPQYDLGSCCLVPWTITQVLQIWIHFSSLISHACPGARTFEFICVVIMRLQACLLIKQMKCEEHLMGISQQCHEKASLLWTKLTVHSDLVREFSLKKHYEASACWTLVLKFPCLEQKSLKLILIWSPTESALLYCRATFTTSLASVSLWVHWLYSSQWK